MNYSYSFYENLFDDDFRKQVKYLGEKDKETNLPKIIPNSHKSMIDNLRQFKLKNKNLDSKIIDAIEKHNRTNFFNFNSQSKTLKQQQVNPYTFMAPVFMEEQTVPSPHIIMTNAHFLDIQKGDKILEIGAGSGYNAAIMAGIDNSIEVYTTEIRENIYQVSKNKIKELDLEDRIKVLKANNDTLGLPDKKFNKIYTTVAAHKTSQIEQLLDQLEIGGILLMPIVKIGNYPIEEKEKTRFFKPGEDVEIIEEKDIYISNPEKGFVRTGTYIFYKTDETNIKYGVSNSNMIGPRLI